LSTPIEHQGRARMWGPQVLDSPGLGFIPVSSTLPHQALTNYWYRRE